ncbi:MAG: hypothetical protein ACI9BO_001356 [Zhongshania sp.]|jgi:hypothetical protein
MAATKYNKAVTVIAEGVRVKIDDHLGSLGITSEFIYHLGYRMPSIVKLQHFEVFLCHSSVFSKIGTVSKYA